MSHSHDPYMPFYQQERLASAIYEPHYPQRHHTLVLSSTQFQAIYTSASTMHGCRLVAAGRSGRVALPVKALKAGQENYWLDQIARNREEYFSGRGESPGRFVGS